jgi:dsRNA-specific ribonuclease
VEAPAAVIAALYLDGGMEAARLHRTLVGADVRRSDADTRDAKQLQEWAQAAARTAARVYLEGQAGPTSAAFV